MVRILIGIFLLSQSLILHVSGKPNYVYQPINQGVSRYPVQNRWNYGRRTFPAYQQRPPPPAFKLDRSFNTPEVGIQEANRARQYNNQRHQNYFQRNRPVQHYGANFGNHVNRPWDQVPTVGDFQQIPVSRQTVFYVRGGKRVQLDPMDNIQRSNPGSKYVWHVPENRRSVPVNARPYRDRWNAVPSRNWNSKWNNPSDVSYSAQIIRPARPSETYQWPSVPAVPLSTTTITTTVGVESRTTASSWSWPSATEEATTTTKSSWAWPSRTTTTTAAILPPTTAPAWSWPSATEKATTTTKSPFDWPPLIIITTTATTTADATPEDYWDAGSGLYDADDAYTDDEDIGAGSGQVQEEDNGWLDDDEDFGDGSGLEEEDGEDSGWFG